MSYRVVIEVRWSRSEKLWTVRRRDVSGMVLAYEEKKSVAVKRGRNECRVISMNGGYAELVVYRQDGAIGEGRGSRSTYPRRSDPRGTKG